MVPIKLNFDDFFSKESYVELQNTFLSKGHFYKYSDDEILYFPKLNLQIQVALNEVELLFEPEKNPRLISVLFEEDFLASEIPTMADYFFNRIKKGAKEANRYSPEEIKYYMLPFLESLNLCLKTYSKAKYLPPNIKSLLIKETHKLIDLCDSYYTNPYPDLKTKLQFKRKRVDIEVFFFLLREKKIINDISDADLGRIIENVCEYEVKKGEGVFKEINDSGKKITDIKNFDKNAEPALSRWRKAFNDFFIYEMG